MVKSCYVAEPRTEAEYTIYRIASVDQLKRTGLSIVSNSEAQFHFEANIRMVLLLIRSKNDTKTD